MTLLSSLVRRSIVQRSNFAVLTTQVRTVSNNTRPIPVSDDARTPESGSQRFGEPNASQPRVGLIAQEVTENDPPELQQEQTEPPQREYTKEEEAIFAEIAEIAKDDALNKSTKNIFGAEFTQPGTLSRAKITTLVQKVEVLAKLANFQVPVEDWEDKPDVVYKLIKLDWRRDCEPCIEELIRRADMKSKDLLVLLSKNPLVLCEPLPQIERRLDYLTADMTDQMDKGGWGMTPKDVCNLITHETFWLSYSIECLRNRMQFLTNQFALSKLELRQAIIRCPRIATWDLRRLVLFKRLLIDEMGFSADQTKRLIIAAPTLIYRSEAVLLRTFELIRKMGLGHEAIAEYPKIFQSRDYHLEQRIGFLEHLGRAQFDPERPNCIAAKDMATKNHKMFVKVTAKSTMKEFEDYLTKAYPSRYHNSY